MSYQTLTVTKDWSTSPLYTASGQTDVALVNPNTPDNSTLFCIMTSDDTPPTLSPDAGLAIPPREYHALVLLDGERLWLAAPQLPTGSVSATLLS
jgi:hypothetical protein